MKVSVIAEQALAPVPGGTGRYTLGLGAALARTAGPGDAVTSWTAWHRDLGPARAAGVRGPRRLALPRRALTVAWSPGPARRVAPAPWVADVVHAPTLLVPPRRGRGLVVTIHDAVPWTHPETLTPRGARWHRRMAEVAVVEADRIVVPTAAVAAALRLVLTGLGPTQLHVIPQGITTALLPPTTRGVHSIGLPARYLLSLATLEPRKGLDILLEALAQPGAPGVALVVVGQPGWGGVDIADHARRLGLGDRVIELGRIPDAQLGAVLAGATALVMPSRAEGFGLPVLEAMAAGVPTITSDDPALVEVAGGASAVAPREDAATLAQVLAQVCGDDALRARMVTAGLARARDFDWDVCARRMWALYAGITACAS
jgi:glycosyltransferase involved in cell wall biosynthesis